MDNQWRAGAREVIRRFAIDLNRAELNSDMILGVALSWASYMELQEFSDDIEKVLAEFVESMYYDEYEKSLERLVDDMEMIFDKANK